MSELKRNTIYCGDALEVLKTLPDECVHMCVTSPPYYALRRYATGKWVGGDSTCNHECAKARGGRGGSGPNGKNSEYGAYPGEVPAKTCSKCGATWEDKQIGVEETPGEYIDSLVAVFTEVRRVLRKDGIFFLNIADCYTPQSSHKGGTQYDRFKNEPNWSARSDARDNVTSWGKSKDLMLIPFEVAKALRDSGWVLRKDIVWAKSVSFCPTYSGTCMPEPVTNRPTSSHEYVFLFSKSGNPSYWMHRDLPRGTRDKPDPDYRYIDRLSGEEFVEIPEGFDPEERIEFGGRVNVKRWRRVNLWWGEDYFYDQEAVKEKNFSEEDLARRNILEHKQTDASYRRNEVENRGSDELYSPSGRNLRSVWTINPAMYPDVHFACVDSETECLTTGGWRRYHELCPGTEIFSYNMETQMLEIQPIEKVAAYRYSGNMVAVFGRSSNMLLTPNHRCVVETRNKRGGMHPPKIVIASNLKQGMKFPVAAQLNFNALIPTEPPEFYELIGWVISEGQYTDGGGVQISQSVTKNAKFCERIEYVLKCLNVDYTSYEQERTYKDNTKYTVKYWTIHGEYRKKIKHMLPEKCRIPEHFLLLPDEYVKSFLNGFISGDGNIRKDNRIAIIQREKQPLDIIQAMFIRLGKSCILSQRRCGIYTAFITDAKSRCFKNATSSLIRNDYIYDGVVWCPVVKHGTWVARRGGRPFITGNTFPPSLIEPMIKLGTSEYGACPKCGAPWVRVVKKGESNEAWKSACGADTTGEYHGESKKFKKQDELGKSNYTGFNARWKAKQQNASDVKRNVLNGLREVTYEWKPSCGCGCEDRVPCIVLDPFGGSGTSGEVARDLGRDYVLVELSDEYIELIKKRLRLNESLGRFM